VCSDAAGPSLPPELNTFVGSQVSYVSGMKIDRVDVPILVAIGILSVDEVLVVVGPRGMSHPRFFSWVNCRPTGSLKPLIQICGTLSLSEARNARCFPSGEICGLDRSGLSKNQWRNARDARSTTGKQQSDHDRNVRESFHGSFSVA
jgi:hypothetical protein